MTESEKSKPTYSPDELPEYLPVYYKRLFPYSLYFRWLNYGGGKYLVGEVKFPSLIVVPTKVQLGYSVIWLSLEVRPILVQCLLKL